MLKKLKDVLFDTTEDDLPIITEKRESTSEIKEVKIPREMPREQIETLPQREEPRPLDIDESLTKKRTSKGLDSFLEDELNITPARRERSTRNFNYQKPKKQVKKEPFKPTPIISPVYGVLDQNYSKDDVVVKTSIGIKNPTLDDVREKAYGPEIDAEDIDASLKTLDEILMSDTTETKTRENKEEVTNEKVTNEKVTNEEITKEEESIMNTAEHLIDEIAEEINKESKETIKEKPDNKEEKDLFNLIDSMYDE